MHIVHDNYISMTVHQFLTQSNKVQLTFTYAFIYLYIMNRQTLLTYIFYRNLSTSKHILTITFVTNIKFITKIYNS